MPPLSNYIQLDLEKYFFSSLPCITDFAKTKTIKLIDLLVLSSSGNSKILQLSKLPRSELIRAQVVDNSPLCHCSGVCLHKMNRV